MFLCFQPHTNFFKYQVIQNAMHIRPATPNEVSGLALLSLEVWSTTYLRRGINGFLPIMRWKDFQKPAFKHFCTIPLKLS